MRVLLDSHALLWAMDAPDKLGGQAASALRDLDNKLLLSAATLWELAIKVGSGKLALGLPYWQWMEKAIADLDLELVPVTVAYAECQAVLPTHHRDPFDRLLIAQALVDDLPVVCADSAFDAYGVKRIW